MLLTAAHVIDANDEMDTTLYLSGDSNEFVRIETEFRATPKPNGDRNGDHYDFAFGVLSDAMIGKLGGGYVTEGDITTKVNQGHLYTAIGYPNSKNRWTDPQTKRTVSKGFSYSSTSGFNEQIATSLAAEGEGAHHVFLSYHKHSRSCEGTKVSSLEPRGLSGGAIIDAGRPSDLRVFREEMDPVPRLVGMTIERWKAHQVLVGVRMSLILRVIEKEFGRRTATGPYVD